MSAWLVSKSHIDMIVQAAINEGLIDPQAATATGTMLWLENHRSLNARYGDTVPEVDYTFAGTDAPLDDYVVYRNLGCYDYQSCEHRGWEASEAHTLVKALSHHLERRHGTLGAEDPDFTRGPDHRDLPWGIDSLEQAVASAACSQGQPAMANLANLTFDQLALVPLWAIWTAANRDERTIVLARLYDELERRGVVLRLLASGDFAVGYATDFEPVKR